jgi:hypothetical protein
MPRDAAPTLLVSIPRKKSRHEHRFRIATAQWQRNFVALAGLPKSEDISSPLPFVEICSQERTGVICKHRISSVSAGRLGLGPAKARQGRRPGRRSVQDQASDRARPDSRDVGGRGSARRGSRRRGLWKRHALPLRPERKESRLIMSSASSRRSARGRPGQRLKGDLRI